MKKNLINLLILMILASLNSYGQFSFGPSFYLGKSKISNNLVSIRTSTNYTEYRNNYVSGIFNEYKFNNWFAMQLDILYNQLNSEQFFITDKDNPNSYRTNHLDKVEYLSLPLTMQFQYKRLNLNVGYQTSFLLSNYYEFTIIDQRGITSNSKGQNNDMFINRDISFITALSYNLYKNIHIEVRFTKGLTNIMNGQAGYVYDASTTQFLIGLYYKIQFKKKEPKNSKTEIPNE